LKTGPDPVGELAGYTGKEPAEIHEVLKDLSDEGVLAVQNEKVTAFIKEKAWSLLSKRVFG
jgi:predicted transcriptional regulator